MLPKVATTILHSTSRAAAAVHGQSHTIRNVLQLQHSNSSSSSQQSSSSQSSTGGSGPNGPAGKGPGSNFFNPNWHGSPGTRDGAARGGRFTHGYLGASRAVSQAQSYAPTSDGPVQLEENQDEFEVVVSKRSQGNPTRRFRSHSLSYSPKERAQKLGVLRTVQLHARSKHVFASPERPDSADASVGECVRPVSPTRLVRSRSNSTTSVNPTDSEGLQLHDLPPPPPPLLELENSVSSSPSSPQSVVPPSQPSSESTSPAPTSRPTSPVSNRWFDALQAARDSKDPEEIATVLNAFRSATSLALEASSQPTSTASLSSPIPRPSTPKAAQTLPPGAHIPKIAELNFALELLHTSRIPGEPLADMLKLYADITKFGQLLTSQGKHNEAKLLKPNFRTYNTMIHALCEREGEVVSAIETMAKFKRRRSWTGVPNSSSSDKTDDRHISILKAENNFRSAIALFQAMASVDSTIPPETFRILLRACAIHGSLATATVPSSSGRPVPVWSPSEQEAMLTEAVTSAIHIWSHLEQSKWKPSAAMYRNMLNTFGKSGTGKSSPARGWEGVKDVWTDFRSGCAEDRVGWDSSDPVMAKRTMLSVWNAMIEASFACGEPGFGVGLLDEMMRVAPSSQDVVSSATNDEAGSQQGQKSSGENLLDAFNPKEIPLPAPATFTTIIAGFVGLALKAINGIPASEDGSEKVKTSHLEAARSALEQYKEHMGTALVWMDKLASMPVGPLNNSLDVPSAPSGSSAPIIARPDSLAWRTVLDALNEGYQWEMDWTERGLEIGDSVTSTFCLPALNKSYDLLVRTITSNPQDPPYLRRIDSRMLFNSNLRHIHALKGRLNWAISKGEQVIRSVDGQPDNDKLGSIQSTITQARRDLFDALGRQERRLVDIPSLAAALDPSAPVVHVPREEEDLSTIDVDMVKRVWEAWLELSALRGSWESVDSTASEDALLLSQARDHAVDIGLRFILSPGASVFEKKTKSPNAFKLIVLRFADDVLERSYPTPGYQPLSFRQALAMESMLANFSLRKKLGLKMSIAFALAFCRFMDSLPEMQSLTASDWRAVLGRYADIELAPKELVDDFLPPASGIQLPDMLAIVRLVQEHAPDFQPNELIGGTKYHILTALGWNRDIKDVEAALGLDSAWLAILREMRVESTSEWLGSQDPSMGYQGPLLNDGTTPDSVNSRGVEQSGEILNDGMSIITEASGSGHSGASIGQSTAPSSPVVQMEQEAHMQAAQIESQALAFDASQPVAQIERYLGGRPIPSHLYIERVHSRNFDGLLTRALGNKDPMPYITEVFDYFVQGIHTHRVPSPYTFARLLQLLGRTKQFDQIQFVYRVAQTMLAQMEQDKKLQSDSWFIIEDGMILAFAQAGEVDAAHVHRMRILQQGGTPSADAYGGLILHVKDTTDDTSNAMALYQEAVTRGVVPNAYLYNNIISKLAKARKADYALELFHEMKASGIQPTSITYGAVIGACARVGDVDSAEVLFSEMAAMKNFKPRVPPFNTMMQLYTTTKPNRERALHYYQLMRTHRVYPTEYTYKLLMEAYVIEPIDVVKMEKVFRELIANPRLQVQGTHFATLINAYGCVAKDLNKAIAVFDSIRSNTHGAQLDALVFEAMTNVLVAHRRTDLIPDYMAKMSAAGVHMTAYIMNLLIKGYSGAGDIEKARELFESLADPPEGMAAINNHAPHDPRITMSVNPMAPVYREPSTWEAMVRAELGAGHRDRALALLERLRARHYPEAVFNRISGILVDHSQIYP